MILGVNPPYKVPQHRWHLCRNQAKGLTIMEKSQTQLNTSSSQAREMKSNMGIMPSFGLIGEPEDGHQR
jgi:hypothetical protein